MILFLNLRCVILEFVNESFSHLQSGQIRLPICSIGEAIDLELWNACVPYLCPTS